MANKAAKYMPDASANPVPNKAQKMPAKNVVAPAKKPKDKDDSRAGRLKSVKTDRGEFRFKNNRKDEC